MHRQAAPITSIWRVRKPALRLLNLFESLSLHIREIRGLCSFPFFEPFVPFVVNPLPYSHPVERYFPWKFPFQACKAGETKSFCHYQ